MILYNLAILSLSLSCTVVNTSSRPSKKSIESLTLNDKKFIADYVYSVMDSYMKGEKIPGTSRKEGVDLDFDYDRVFISLYNQNKLLGCQSGSAKRDTQGRMFLDLKEASIDSMKDTRFDKDQSKKLDRNNYVILNFLFNKQKMKQNNLAYMEKNIELGIHSVSVGRKKKRVYFISSVPITKNYDLERMLKQLCKKGKFNPTCYLDKDTEIHRYDTVVFRADRQDHITDLYRFNILVDESDVTQKRISESLSLAKDWVMNNINPETNLLEYTYYPSKDTYSKKNHHIRQLATLWALTELRNFLKTKELDGLVKRTFEYYLSHERTKDDYAYLAADKNPSIALNAFMMMALSNSDLPEKKTLLKRLAGGILNLQLPDGSYQTLFMSKEVKGVNYYPGEAMLALMTLYQATKEPLYLDSVKKAFPYYREYWRNNKNTALIPWHTQTYYLLYKETRDPELAEFIFEMSDWLIDNHQIYESQYIDQIGGFPKKNPSGCSTAVYLEGINDAYSLAMDKNDNPHKNKYARSISLGIRFVLQSQINKENSFHLKNSKKAIGGTTKRLTDNSQRIDYIQHTIRAFLKTYENKIFE